MRPTSDRLEVLYRTQDEFEAAMIVGALEEHGIAARTVGGYVSGFKAEAPGGLAIMVAAADASTARELLLELQREGPEIDWNAVDFQDESPVDENSEAESSEAGPSEDADEQPCHDRHQYSLASLVVLQAAICIVLWLWKTASLGAVWPGLLLVLALSAFVISGTILIATNPAGARRLWIPLGQLITVGFVAYVFLQMFLALL